MSYYDFYRLNLEPFSNAPAARFYFSSPQHETALGKLRFGIGEMRGLLVVAGSPGSGKTILARRLLSLLPDAEYEAALLVIVHSAVSPEWLLRRIALQLGVKQPSHEKLGLLSQLFTRLVEIQRAGKKAVVLIDEAQMLASKELMEEFRGLLNLELPGRKLINFVLFGMPEIDEVLALDPPLAQRIAMRCRLSSFDAPTSRAYILHRLALCGREEPLFSEAALDAIYAQTAGVPRLINTLCDNLLYEGALREMPVIEEPLVQDVARDLFAPFSVPAGAQASTGLPASASPRNDREVLDEIDRILRETDPA